MAYKIMTRSAQVSGKAREFGRYRRVAVVEWDGVTEPAMISARARGMVRIVREWPSCSVGTTERCQYARALVEAETLLAELASPEAR